MSAMDDFKMLPRPHYRFKGLAETWPDWRDTAESILRAGDLYQAIEHPRPEAPYPPPPPADAPGVGEPKKDEKPAAPAAPPAGPNLQEQWDRRNAKIYMFLQLYTDGIAKSVVSQYRITGDGAEAWRALGRRFDPIGTLGKTKLHRRINTREWTTRTDPEDYFLDFERDCTGLQQ